MEKFRNSNRIIIALSRFVLVFFAVFSFVFFASASTQKAMNLYKAQDYKGVKSHYETLKTKMSFKDHALYLTSLKRLGLRSKRLQKLEESVKAFPEKDVLKRELALAYEEQSASYPNSKKFEGLIQDYRLKSIRVLEELKNTRPTKENLTAFIHFYIRQEDYTESLSLLELYSRTKPKGENYAKLLCEVQFKAKLYQSSERSCENLKNYKKHRALASLYHLKSVQKNTDDGIDISKTLVKLAGRFPASSEIQYEAGKSLIEKGFSKKGLNLLEKHIELGKPEDEALILKAEELFKLKNYKGALQTFIKACKQHQEPRKPLLFRFKKVAREISNNETLKRRYLQEVDRCKYNYKPQKRGVAAQLKY